ncbi:MAG: multicopper oxidase domain-containing protein [Thermodesulfovibrionales bacterium]
MSNRRSILRWLMIAVALCCCAGIAAADEPLSRQDAMKAIEQAAIDRAANDPLFKQVLTNIANSPQPEGVTPALPSTPPPHVRTPNVAYVYPWAANVAPPHYNPGIGFNNSVNYDLPNYSQSPNIRKFVDKLPGLGTAGCFLGTPTFSNASCTGAGAPVACCTAAGTGSCVAYSDGTCNANNLGQFIPVAVPEANPLYPGHDYYEIKGKAYSTKMNSDLPPTSLWGYQQTESLPHTGYTGGCTPGDNVCGVSQYLGPLLLARVYDPSKPPKDGCPSSISGRACNGAPVRLKFTNGLPLSNTAGGRMGLPIDTTLMGAGTGPTNATTLYTENRLTTPHLHGGRTPWISDGTPHQWLTPAGDPTIYQKGVALTNVPDMIGAGKTIAAPSAGDGMTTSFFSNEQSARLMFWHDHAFGTTRLTVYKGVAAGYLLVDQVEDDLIDGSNYSGVYGPLAPLPAGSNPKILPNLGGIYRYGIPLVIQDKSFVNDGSTDALRSPNFPSATYDHTFHTADTDPLWFAPPTAMSRYPGPTVGGGNLWMSHEYMPVENIFDPTGNMTNGRWDYGPFMIPPMAPLFLTLPSPTTTPESFGDTAVVNGTAFPYVELPPDAVRFRILSVGNDRSFNLQLYKADPLTITLTNPGSGYLNASCTAAGVPALCCTGAGTGTCTPPTVTITNALGDVTGTYTSAAAQVSTGEITNISASWGCIGYTAPPVVTITPVAPDTSLTAGCTQVAAIIGMNSGGMITGFQFNGCTGFTVAPIVTVTGSGVTTCVATATVAPPGQILGITVTGAAGYTAVPAVAVVPGTGGGSGATANAYTNTEVRMVDAAPNPSYPTWPKDGRDGGVPDPTTQGPPWILIGNEGGLLAQVAVIPPQPVDFEYVRQNIPFAGVTSHSLLMFPAQRADVIVDLRGATDGSTYLLYNDAPAPLPQPWPINDYYTDNPDQRVVGGPPTTPPGFGPNTRTVMQIRIKTPAGFVPSTFNLAALQTMIPKAFAIAQDPPIVPQLAYNAAFPTGPHTATANNYVQAPESTVNLSGVAQSIKQIKTIAPGNNYGTIAGPAGLPVVTIVGGGGSGALATAGLNPMGGVTLLTSGAGCTSAAAVAIGAPGAGGVQATVKAIVSGGIVNSLTVDEPGSNYSTTVAPTCTITGCTTAATCSTFVAVANTVGSITVTNPGGGYTREPRVYITDPANHGQAAAAVALLNGAIAVMTTKSITEGNDPEYGRLDIRLGSTPNPLTPTVGAGFVMGLARYIDPPTEIVNDNEATVWRITHLGVDSHALHFHLFDVQVVNRIDWTNVVKPPYSEEIGWRDTIRTNPMEDIIVAFKPHQVYLPFTLPVSMRVLDPTTPLNSTVSFYPVAPPAGIAAVPQLSNVMTNFGFEYVFHCHMLGHEENDFMRPVVFNVPVPATPTGLFYNMFNVPSLHVNLGWAESNLNGATKYVIQRATNTTNFTTPAPAQWSVIGNPAPTTTVDNTVVLNQTYYYRVSASNAAGASGWSAPFAVATVWPPTGLAGGAVSAGNGTDTATLTWVSGVNPTSFTIQRLDFTVGITTYVVTPGTLRTFVNTGLTPGNTYWYRIRTDMLPGVSTPYTAEIAVVAP